MSIFKKNTHLTLLSYLIIISYVFTGCGPKDPAESDKKLKSGIESLNKNDVDKAISELTLSIENNTKNSSAYYYRGIAYTSKKMNNEAIADFNEAIEYGDSARFYDARGFVELNINDIKKAQDDFDKAFQK